MIHNSQTGYINDKEKIKINNKIMQKMPGIIDYLFIYFSIFAVLSKSFSSLVF